MRLIRFRRPSLSTVLGVTRAKKRLKRELGITALLRPFRAWGNAKRRVKRRLGYYSMPARVLRNGVPTPLGMGRGEARNAAEGGGCVLLFVAGVIVWGLWEVWPTIVAAASAVLVPGLAIGGAALVLWACIHLWRWHKQSALRAYAEQAKQASQADLEDPAPWDALTRRRARLPWSAAEIRQEELRVFMDALMQALDDARLEGSEVRRLNHIARQLALGPSELKPLLLNCYRERHIAAIEDRVLTPAEDHLLDTLRGVFGLSDDDIAAELAEVDRFRDLKCIRDGRLPVVGGTGLPLKRNETCHFRSRGERLRGRAMPEPSEPIDELVSDSGELAITDRRVIFAGSRTTRMPLDDIACADVDPRRGLLHLCFHKRRTPLVFRLPDLLEAEAVLIGSLSSQ